MVFLIAVHANTENPVRTGCDCGHKCGIKVRETESRRETNHRLPGCRHTGTVHARTGMTLGRAPNRPCHSNSTHSPVRVGQRADAATYVGILKGQALDAIAKNGWDTQHGVAVEDFPAPVPGASSSLYVCRAAKTRGARPPPPTNCTAPACLTTTYDFTCNVSHFPGAFISGGER